MNYYETEGCGLSLARDRISATQNPQAVTEILKSFFKE